ncbi:MAG: DUF2760 domain-containing protein [Bradymonadia bacterium]
MDPAPLSFGARLVLAFVLPWRLLFDGALAGRVKAAADGQLALPEPQSPEPQGVVAEEAAPEPQAPEPAPEPEVVAEEVAPEPAGPDYTSALQVLSILQREGRLIDFLQEDLAGAGDADIGAAARVVHEGCKRALSEYVSVEAIRTEMEGDPVTLEKGFDPEAHRLTGNVVGAPPFKGTLAHHGWRVSTIKLPELAEGRDPHVVAPAEVEL